VRLFDRIKRWAETPDDDKVSLDRRAFLKGMAVTSAGLLVPGAAVFDMGTNYLSMPRVFVPNVPLTETPLLTLADIQAQRFARMALPIAQRLDYGSLARNLIVVEPLPS